MRKKRKSHLPEDRGDRELEQDLHSLERIIETGLDFLPQQTSGTGDLKVCAVLALGNICPALSARGMQLTCTCMVIK